MDIKKIAEEVLERFKADTTDSSRNEKMNAAKHATFKRMSDAGEIRSNDWYEYNRLVSIEISKIQKEEKETTENEKPLFSEKDRQRHIKEAENAEARETKRTEGPKGEKFGIYDLSDEPGGKPGFKIK